MTILLYGYYNQGNFGDELFDLFFSTYFEKKVLPYIKLNPSELGQTYKQIEKVNLIFFGGGEIINDYFMIPLFQYILFHKLYNVPIYGASIGYSVDLPIKYLNFFDKCIFRNNLQIINNQNYFFDNDIIFGLNHIIDIKELADSIIIDSKIIGFYMIDKIAVADKMNIIEFIQKIKLLYKIRFVVFDKKFDPEIINQIIIETNLSSTQYEIIIPTDLIDTIKWILRSEKHFCMRFHAHIICYMFKRQFISYPLTHKTIEFNITHNIKFNKNPNELIELLNKSDNIIFEELIFNIKYLDQIMDTTNMTNTQIIDKRTTLWFIITEIYIGFIDFVNLIITNSINSNMINSIINNITDQIELNILGNIDTSYRFGIIEKINDIIIKINDKTYNTKTNFIKIITDL